MMSTVRIKKNEQFTMSHGSGGELTNRMLNEGIFKLFKNKYIQKKHDGAILELNGKIAFTTDSFIVSPIYFPGGNIGDLAVNGTINDLAMCGAIPRFLSLSFIIEEGFDTLLYYDILSTIQKCAEATGVEIVTGDTKVVEKGKGDKIFINTTGIGEVHPMASIDMDRICDGDKVIISGPLAAHGMAVMSVREGLEFDSQIISDTRSVHQEVLFLIERFGQDVHFLRDPTRGGLTSVLNEISRGSGKGIMLEERYIPLEKQVQAACEMLGIDPLNVASEGVFLAIVNESSAESILKSLKTLPYNQSASIIGSVQVDCPGQVIVKSQVGGKRILPMPTGEQLPRIC